MPQLLSLCLYLPIIFSGFWLAQLLWPEPSPAALRFKLFLGIPLGLGLWSLGYFLWIWAGLSRFIFPWVEISVSTVLALLSLPTLKRLAVSISFRPLTSPLNLAFLLVSLTAAALFGLWLYMNPHGYEDAWFIWNLDSRFIYRANDFRILYGPGFPGWHPDYPLMVSLNVVSGWVLLGQDTPRVQVAVTALFTLILPGVLYSGLALLKDTKQAALATIVLLASPMILHYGVAQQADIPVAGYVLAALMLAALFFKTGETNLLFLAGLAAGLSAWAKNEGFLFILTSAGLLAAQLVFSRQPRAFLKLAAGVILPLSIVLLYKVFLPPKNDLLVNDTLSQLLDGSRYRFILLSLVEYAANLGWWPVVGLPAILGAYSLLAWFEIPEPRIARFVALALLFQLAGYVVIYLLTPHTLIWHVDTSFERLLLHLFPAALFLVFYITQSPNFNLLEGWQHASRD
jgi:hypothetical protein